MIIRTASLLCAATLLVAVGCGRTGSEGETDSEEDGDVVNDTAPDFIPDFPPDIMPDTIIPPDVVPDTVPPDTVPPDIPPDTGPDIVPDIPPDTRPDPRPDTRPDTRPEVIPDIFPDAPGGLTGDPCARRWDCMGVPGSGRMCLTTVFGYITFPGGYCSASCTAGWECGTGGTCVDVFGIGNYCLKYCSSFFDCRFWEGYSCTTLMPGSPTFCLPPLPGPDGGPIDP